MIASETSSCSGCGGQIKRTGRDGSVGSALVVAEEISAFAGVAGGQRGVVLAGGDHCEWERETEVAG